MASPGSPSSDPTTLSEVVPGQDVSVKRPSASAVSLNREGLEFPWLANARVEVDFARLTTIPCLDRPESRRLKALVDVRDDYLEYVVEDYRQGPKSNGVHYIPSGLKSSRVFLVSDRHAG